MNRSLSLAWTRGRMPLLLLTLLLLAGCYERTVQGSKTLYQFSGWIGPTVIVLCLLAIPLGWLLREQRWGWVFLIVAPILLLVVAPAMYSDYVLIDDDHFEARYGFWFAPSKHVVRFEDLREIRYVAVQGSRGRINHEIHCQDRTGQVTVVHAGDLVRNTVPEIFARAQARGVPVMNQGR